MNSTIYSAEAGGFLSPSECGSSILWNVGVGVKKKGYGDEPNQLQPKMYGSVMLTDCSHSISWSLTDDGSVEKLDKAIAILKAARKALKIANAKYEELENDEE